MKNTFKRFVALAVVLCTLGAMMIPGVSAAENDVIINFSGKTNGDFAKLGLAASTNLSAAANLEVVNTAYANGDIQWGIHATDTRALEVRTNTLYLRMRQYSNATHAHVALSFKVKVDGNYFLSLGYYQNEAQSDRVGAYIIETPEVALTNNNGTLRKTVGELKKNGDPLVAFPGNSATGTYTAENTIALKAEQEYLLILFSETAVTTTDSREWFSGFSLIYDSPLASATCDYSVTYNAGYEGADAVVDSLTSTETSVEFTAKAADTFTREGYTFEGWATTEGGAVAYAAGDKITVTSENPNLNLYAVWAEIPTEPEEPEPIKTDDLIVDFYTEQVEKLGMIKSGTTNVATGGSFRSYYNNYRNAYIAGTIHWQPYATNDTNRATLVALNTTLNGTESNGGLFSNAVSNTRLVLEMKAQTPGLIFTAIKFRSPGTGNYKLTVEHLKRASALQNPTETGAYILAMPETGYTPDTLPRVNSEKVLTKVVLTDKAGVNGFYTSEGTVALEQGKEYIIVFYADHETAQSNIMFAGFSLKYQKPEAIIGETAYATLAEALNVAASGDIIKLNSDVTVEGALDLGAAVLDLNGKKITAGAVVGSVKDSGNGNGLIAAGQDSILTTATNDLAVWDNTTDASGYRIFTYEFTSHGVSAGQDDVTAVNKSIVFYDYEAALGTKDNRFRNVSADMAAKFAEGTLDWRVELASQNYQFRIPGDIEGNDGTGSNGFSSGTQSIAYRSAGWFAIRVKAPGEGKIGVTLKTDESNADIFDVYIVKASEIEKALGENYAAYSEAMANNLYNGGDNAIYTAYIAAVEAAFADEDVVISVDQVGQDATFSGSYNFEAGEEYVVICNVISGTNMRLESITFSREEKKGATQSFWSVLEFNNMDAYKLVAASDLKVGFTMDWNGFAKDFEFDAATVNAWADKVVSEPDTDWGFYIRMSGFEALTESGTLTGKPYIEVKNERVYATNKVLTYEYTYTPAE